MGLLSKIQLCLFSSRVEACLLELQINTRQLDPNSVRLLREIGMLRSEDLSPHEAALFFLALVLPTMSARAFMLPMRRHDYGSRARMVGRIWTRQEKVRAFVREAIYKTLIGEDLWLLDAGDTSTGVYSLASAEDRPALAASSPILRENARAARS
jgi:hypothetical protein